MATEAGRMSRLIEDLLSLSRVESLARVRPTGRADLSELLTSATMSLGKQAQEKSVALVVEGAEESHSVPGDADQPLQGFTNLTANAIKYGGARGAVRLERMGRDPILRGGVACVTVLDNGSGIDPLDIPRLTERFYRVDSHRSRALGGTGLGLAIVKHIVSRHRGRLKIESTLGEGSRFSVILPV